MYAETGLMFPNYLNFSQQLQDLCFSPKPSSSLQDSIIPTSIISDYDLGGEGDLFKAPKPIVEEPIIHLDPMTSAMSLIACGDDVMSQPDFKVCGMDSLQSEQLLNDVFDGCGKELLEKGSIETELSDALDTKLIPILTTNEVSIHENKPLLGLPLTRSGSSGSLTSIDLVYNATVRPSFLDFPNLDLEAAYGMRRAFSEGDIKTLNNDNLSLIHSIQRPLAIGPCTTEERLQKLSRYRNKKARRNFGRKIKYACRKALADSQPRIRGRFAKTEDTDNNCKKG